MLDVQRKSPKPVAPSQSDWPLASLSISVKKDWDSLLLTWFEPSCILDVVNNWKLICISIFMPWNIYNSFTKTVFRRRSDLNYSKKKSPPFQNEYFSYLKRCGFYTYHRP
jgi:hypothetical protein